MCVTLLSFVVLAILFVAYDSSVERRQTKVLSSAIRSNALVSSIFPDAIRDRLLHQNAVTSKPGHLKSYLLHGEKDADGNSSGKPLADLFLETTVLFADISGFTAWRSEERRVGKECRP